MNINSFMPSVIKENHDNFIKRFFAEGKSRKIGTAYSNFMKTYHGYLLPII